ncbi:hypothetical protein ABGB19_01995 [Mycobacterium sp. B14F4]|uniref:hypothetical protein n=1 Tax=Mycobacterium sp. B14F4 TaxID=3153565 RepID=UPI00325C481A
MASASVLAVSPVMPTPAVPDVREAAIELSALANPLTEWQQTIANTFTSLNRLSTEIPAASSALLQALGNPGLHAELVNSIVANVTNPLPLLSALANFQATYGDRIAAGNADTAAALQEAFATLPAVLVESARFLAQGEFLEAFSALNTWFLVNLLSDSRQSLLGVLAIPGDFADSVGLPTLARVFDSLLNRAVAGNLGRALLTAHVTSTIQTMEILDRTRAALQSGDPVTAAGELINLPASYLYAFLNGYVPDFVPDLPNQTFPGLLHSLGFVNFFFVQIPNAIAGALAAPAAPAAAAFAAGPDSPSPTDVPGSGETFALTVETGQGASTLGETGESPLGTTTTVAEGNSGESHGGVSGDDDTGEDDETAGDDGTTGGDEETTGDDDDTSSGDDDSTGDDDASGSTGSTTAGGTSTGDGVNGGGTSGGDASK